MIVLRATVRADEASDVESEAAKLRAECDRSSLPGVITETLVGEVTGALEQLIPKARELASIGSRLNVTRTIEVEGHRVDVHVTTGQGGGLWRRLLRTFGVR